jgi:GTP cyclohydrolase I
MAKKLKQKNGLTPQEILSAVRPTPYIETGLSDDEKISRISAHFTEIMEILGLDLENDSLRDTPKRVAKMFVTETFRGLSIATFPKITVVENKMGYDQMVFVKNVKVMSTCEHHFVTIHGRAHIAYIPKERVIGLSKINRITDFFSRRPQVQERLTKQIADCLEYVLGTNDVAVHIDARHYCVISRGVEDANSTTITSDLRGAFRSQAQTRAEFLAACN